LKWNALYLQTTIPLCANSLYYHKQNTDKLDHIVSLERCAQTTLFLVQDLKSSTDIVSALTTSKVVAAAPSDSNAGLPSLRTALEQDTERAQFLMKLAPRIRRLESDTIMSLTFRMEEILKILQDRRKSQNDQGEEEGEETRNDPSVPSLNHNDLLLMIGHCMRGLAFLGRAKEVENIFARVAIM
jgi:hypothetical protein